MANYELFITKAPGIMDDLRDEFGFSEVQAAAVLGNLGHECNGFHSMQEIHPIGGRGGYGWAQWTGPRRRAFEQWCQDNDLNIDSDRANYGFLKLELSTTHDYARRALLRESDLVRAVRVFERKYLVAGIPHYPSRERYAEIAIAAYRARTGVHALAEAAAGESEEAWLDDGLGTLRYLGTAGTARRSGYSAAARGSRQACGCNEEAKRLEAVGIASVTAPVINDTASWNARPPAAPITVLNRRPKGIVIHHTASANVSDMSLTHAKALARTIQDFHMGPRRGWIDTGQHFTVTRGGHILEGRHRSLEMARGGLRHVLGAHAGTNCNAGYVGIENEGTYMVGLPTHEQWASLVQLCTWLCSQYGMSTDDIIGHRQCKSTDCPGDRFFGQLAQLRQDVQATA